jgi:hypothetical protein
MNACGNEWAELGHALDALAQSGLAEVHEDGEWLAELTPLQCELRSEGQSPFVHLWSERRNLTRRILRIRERTPERIVLEVQRFGRARPGRLELLRKNAPRSSARITREQFRAFLRRWLAERFPDATIDSLSAAPDLKNSFSGLYVRGRMREGPRTWAFLAVSPRESAAAVEGILAFGILWLDWTRHRAELRAIDGLRLFVPQGTGRFLRQRVAGLAASARVELFEFSEADGRIEKVDLADAGNVETWLVPRREAESALRAARETASRHPVLQAKIAEEGKGVAASFVGATSEVAFLFRGLEFARWSQGIMRVGAGDAQQRLPEAARTSFAKPLDELLDELELHRSSVATETNHPLYRFAPERWLEAILREDPTRLDAQLDPRYLYSQVPAFAVGDRGVLDLLGVTRRGRLVVIELKASEDIQLPLQAVDYWLRVRRHQRDGDFARYGYFPGVELDAAPPLVWLVAPGLRFHSATEILLRYLAPEIQITRIGLGENWRRGIRIIFRQSGVTKGFVPERSANKKEADLD